MRRQNFDEPGHALELTFCCYRRLPLLEDDEIKQHFLDSLGRARLSQRFDIWAYVVMPEHVHLLVRPREEDYKASNILQAIKRPSAQAALAIIKRTDPALFRKLHLADGATERFWQAGGGYVRNLFTPEAIHAAVDYLHANPLRRGLVENTTDWKWSSARWYAGMEHDGLRMDACDALLQVVGSGASSR